MVQFIVIIVIIALALYIVYEHQRGADVSPFINSSEPAIVSAVAKQQRDEQIGYLEIMRRERQRIETIRQARLVGDELTVDEVLADNYKGPLPQLWSNEEAFSSIYPDRLLIFSVAGINYAKNIRAYVGEFRGALLPDPKNDFDPEAIKIVVEDGHHIGFVPQTMTGEVRSFAGHPDVNDTNWRHYITGRIEEREDDSDPDNPRSYFIGIVDCIAAQ